MPYVDYSRDYNPPVTRNSLYSGMNGGGGLQYLNNVDPRYSATYGNPYLRTSNNCLPPPPSHNNHSPNSHPLTHHHTHTPTTPPFGGGSTTGSTSPHSHNNPLNNSTNPYGMRNGGVPHGGVPHIVPRGSSTPSPQYIVPSQSQLKPGTLATHV